MHELEILAEEAVQTAEYIQVGYQNVRFMIVYDVSDNSCALHGYARTRNIGGKGNADCRISAGTLQPIAFVEALISISNLNLLGLFSTECCKRAVEKLIID